MTLVHGLAYVFAVLCVVAAIYVALGKHLLRTGIAFFIEVAAVAGLLLSMNAEFLAMVVMAFALMAAVLVTAFSSVTLGNLKTKLLENREGNKGKAAAISGALVGLGAGAVLGLVWLSPGFRGRLGANGEQAVPQAVDARALGNLFLGQQLVTFEMLAVLVLVAVIGAGLLLRKSNDGR